MDEPHDLEYYLRSARRAVTLGDFESARHDLIKALDINPDSPRAINLAGVMLEMRGEYESAKQNKKNQPTTT